MRRSVAWTPSWGAIHRHRATEFRVWAPDAVSVDVIFDRAGRIVRRPLVAADGVFSGLVPAVPVATRYTFSLDDGPALPDPASRWQPDGPHGRSAIVDPHLFVWTDDDWRGIDVRRLIIYELHVGAFTHEGTFDGVVAKLDALAELGVTAIELMPIAEFAGRWNWGYDGVSLYAPSHRYGSPDDLRRLVNAAHRRGLAVILDVVYNHLGPDGASLPVFASRFFSDRHRTPWGKAVNFDAFGSELVRSFLIDNALHWIHEYHIDGLRLDATHALFDDSPTHFLAELSGGVQLSVPSGRRVLLIAEDERNEAALLKPVHRGGFGLDAVWADDFHHQVRRMTAGDRDAYFASYQPEMEHLVRTVRQGWLFTGQTAVHTGASRGTDPADIPLERFVICIQNHDQVGNRPFGDRLSDAVDPATYRALSALLLLAPETPLLFMGQEWSASTPFQFFSDHAAALGEAVTNGRREEFATFGAFSDPVARSRIPDPQAEDTFLASRLIWEERALEEHSRVLALYHDLLQLRTQEPSFGANGRDILRIAALDEDTIVIQRVDERGSIVIVRVRGAGSVAVPLGPTGTRGAAQWRVALTTEEDAYASPAEPPAMDWKPEVVTITFTRPSAVVLTRVQIARSSNRRCLNNEPFTHPTRFSTLPFSCRR